MNYEYKITTHGRAVMVACWDLEKPLKITRVTFGAGRVEETAELADVHQLLEYVSDGALADRRHEDDRLFLTIQYANSTHPEVTRVFYLSEFAVWVEDPETGKETDLIYGTLGDYRQPVPPYAVPASPGTGTETGQPEAPAYNAVYPPSVFNFPLEIVLSNEIQINSSAPSGLITYEELNRVTEALAIRRMDIVIPAEGWESEVSGDCRVRLDLPVEDVTDKKIPQVTILPAGESAAWSCGLRSFAEALDGAVRFWAVKPPMAPIPASLALLRDSSGLVFQPIPDLPVATETEPGVVKPGPGLSISPDGTISVNSVSNDDIRKALETEEDAEPSINRQE